ncbi:MAG TPA: NAD(P)-dependent alcohol dehydrogenase [Candidatus Limnocylindrales bacterium]|jgi:NADPH:quinone reductase-like Zn-dependent oxidoreductase|nr:NAD(P)-dependent alcohol dehydrogenase [Candidatus Limnocylindrales bacterium]
MKAVVQDRYGPPEVVHIEEVERPAPKADEVLIRVRASTVSQSDTHVRAGSFWRLVAGFRRPSRWPTLGVEFAGVVEAVGASVTEFKVGDEVFGMPSAYFGAHAEYVCVRTGTALARKPPGMTFEEAAAVCDGAMQALSALRQADARDGRRIAIYGASGSLGTAGVQLAKHFGAHVTGICSTRHVELVRSLGADDVVDYLQQDFTKTGQTYDAIIDAVGKYSFRRGRRALKPGGIYVATDGGRFLLETFAMWIVTRLVGSRRVRTAIGRRSREDVHLLKELIEAGEFRAVIDRSYPMDQAAEAHRYVETWRKAGNVVLTIP